MAEETIKNNPEPMESQTKEETTKADNSRGVTYQFCLNCVMTRLESEKRKHETYNDWVKIAGFKIANEWADSLQKLENKKDFETNQLLQRIFWRFDTYSCIKDDKWYKDLKKELQFLLADK